MAVDANFKFLARQLALSDFAEGAVEEVDGGCMIRGQCVWGATWDTGAISDTDSHAEKLLNLAGKSGIEKWLMILPGGAVDDPRNIALAESLYLCGLARAEFGETGIPDNIQVLNKPVFPNIPDDVSLLPIEPGDQRLFALISESIASDEYLGYQLSGMTNSPLSTLEYCIATKAGTPVGAIAWRSCGVINRIAWVWVGETHRTQGVGSALVAHAVEAAAGTGAVVSTVWTGLKGSLRYYFSKLGFEDQLRVITFLPE